jgi:hypothetical protein
MVVCPYCHQETNINANGIFSLLGHEIPIYAIRYHNPNRKMPNGHWAVCIKCSGPLGISKFNNKLYVGFGNLPDCVTQAEKILDRKAAQTIA